MTSSSRPLTYSAHPEPQTTVLPCCQRSHRVLGDEHPTSSCSAHLNEQDNTERVLLAVEVSRISERCRRTGKPSLPEHPTAETPHRPPIRRTWGWQTAPRSAADGSSGRFSRSR